MGVIKKILFRDNILGKPRHRNLFLDMEENIHIHYRDLRIELSRGEFEDIVSAFGKQSKELMAIIREKHYQDGKLPNANQDDVRIWTESRLKNPVKYHPTRLSIEECGDGYHFHYRNYKFLIDPPEFRRMVELFRSMDLDADYAAYYDEVVQLLEDNDVDFTLDAGDQPGERLVIRVAKHHMPKVRDIFNYIGFEQEADGENRRYTGSNLRVEVRPDTHRTALDYRHQRGLNHVGLLVDYLARRQGEIDPNELNHIKLQFLELYYSLCEGDALNVETNPELWLYAPANRQVIFPYSPETHGGKSAADQLYLSWNTLIKGFDMHFVKPVKEAFPKTVQIQLKEQIEAALIREAAAYRAVEKIYIMGSGIRDSMGIYQAPFVHGKLVKLGSDVDILIEINPDRESDLPAHWNLYLPEASNHCAVYHIGEVPLAGPAGDWAERHPHVPFIDHLLDAYVYLPSRGYRTETDAFLKKFGAVCFYDRDRDGPFYRDEEEAQIAQRLTEHYDLPFPAVEPMKVSTENALFRVFASEGDYILKLFKASGNHHRSQVAEHTEYEEQLVNQLVQRGIPTAAIRQPTTPGSTQINGFPALLFARISGSPDQRPEYPLERICPALARIHQVQIDEPLALAQTFTFDHACMIWLPLLETYLQEVIDPPALKAELQHLEPIAREFFPGENRTQLFARSPHVHCQGDVTPKNVIVTQDDPAQALWFDFNNAFYGPRMVDLMEGAIEFSLAEKYVHLADFSRFDWFIEAYQSALPLSESEQQDIPHWLGLVGSIKLAKEIRILRDPVMSHQHKLRHKRALALSDFLVKRLGTLPKTSNQL